MHRFAVFSCLGLGDGLIALVLSNNLQLNGKEVTTFHPFLESLSDWFPSHKIRSFPPPEEMESVLSQFDHFFVIYEKSPWMQAILQLCHQKFPRQTTVLNPIATHKTNYPYWEGGRFDGTRSFVDNLYAFCKDTLKFSVTTKSNGISVPDCVYPKKFSNRIIFHPSSSRHGKNWPSVKFLELAKRLKSEGFAPSVILMNEERQGWNIKEIEAPHFEDLSEVASYVCESGWMIGNDSGIGHLASCLGLPTVTVCRSVQASQFWRPSWSNGKVITPSAWIPNIKGLRLRDRYWKKWISVRRVLNDFKQLCGP